MFEPGVAYQLSPLIRRITAPNPGPMTGAGTNTYLIGRDRIAVIDPGPAIDSHIEAILDAANGAIVLTLTLRFSPSLARAMVNPWSANLAIE